MTSSQKTYRGYGISAGGQDLGYVEIGVYISRCFKMVLIVIIHTPGEPVQQLATAVTVKRLTDQFPESYIIIALTSGHCPLLLNFKFLSASG